MTHVTRPRFVAPLLTMAAFAASLVFVPAPARAQDVMSKESVAELKASFLADLEVVRGKFVGLAEAFPQDKYDWRPMDGVRRVSGVALGRPRPPRCRSEAPSEVNAAGGLRAGGGIPL